MRMMSKSPTTTDDCGELETMAAKLQAPIHPGEILRGEFMIPMGLSSHALARALSATAARVNDIANEKRGVTAGTAQRLGRYFGTMANVWIDLQKAVQAGNRVSRTWQHADAHRPACCLMGVHAHRPLPQGAASARRPRGDWPRPRSAEHMA